MVLQDDPAKEHGHGDADGDHNLPYPRALLRVLRPNVVQNERQPEQTPTNTILAKPMTKVFRHPTGVSDAPQTRRTPSASASRSPAPRWPSTKTARPLAARQCPPVPPPVRSRCTAHRWCGDRPAEAARVPARDTPHLAYVSSAFRSPGGRRPSFSSSRNVSERSGRCSAMTGAGGFSASRRATPSRRTWGR